jgi:hypothetical protein
MPSYNQKKAYFIFFFDNFFDIEIFIFEKFLPQYIFEIFILFYYCVIMFNIITIIFFLLIFRCLFSSLKDSAIR